MKSHLLMMAVILPVAAAMGGCQDTGEKRHFFDLVDAPKVSVEKVELLDESDQGVRVAVTVKMTNSNDVPLPMTIANYSVHLSGMGEYRGDQRPQATIPAKGEQRFVLTAAMAKSPGQTPATYRAGGNIEYRPPGEFRMLLTESGVPLPTVSFADSGDLAAAQP